jgi:outer membrane biosynthesis protein TonB
VAVNRSYWPRLLVLLTLAMMCDVLGFAQSTGSQQSSQPKRPLRIRVASGVMQGMVDHEAVPAYPDQALQSGIRGNVIFVILVNEEGKIISANAVEGDPLLIAVSTDALRQFRFRPFLLNGVPVQVETQLEYQFSLHGKGPDAKGKVEYVSNIPYRPEFRTGAVNADGTLVLWPRKISGPEPQLPPELAGKSGTVYLTIVIGADGKVQDVKIVGGDEEFIAPVVAAAKQTLYEPEVIGGKPTVSTTEATYHFGPQN